MGKQVYDYTDMLNNFSENLKSKRKQLGLTQKELAKKVGVSFRTIQNYENGLTPPTLSIVEKIILVLAVDFEQMFLPINDESINYVKEFKKIDIDKINYLVMNINFSIEELNKELSKLDFLK